MKKKLLIALVSICVVVIVAGGFGINHFMINNKYDFLYYNDSKGGDRIHFISVGNGDAVLLESQGKYALIDAGEDTDNPRGFDDLELDGYEDYVIDYLNKFCSDANGQVNLEFIIGTHSHSDHIGAFDTIVMQDNIHIKKAYFKRYFQDRIIADEVETWDNQEVYDQAINAINQKGIPLEQDLTDVKLELGEYKLTVFNGQEPEEGQEVGENGNSLAILVEKNGYKVMLSGDMDNYDGDEARVAPLVGKVDILKLGHHGYKGSSSKEYISALEPKLTIQTTFNPPDLPVYATVTLMNKIPIYSCVKKDGIIVDLTNTEDVVLYKNVK